MLTTKQARLIAGRINSGPNTPIHDFYYHNILDTRAVVIEINSIMRYANPKERKSLKMLQEYALMTK